MSQVSNSESIERLEDEVLNLAFSFSPRYAVFLGLHEYDGLLPDFSSDHLRSVIEKAEELKGRVARTDTSNLDARRKLDVLGMQLLLEDGLFEIKELQSHTNRPVGYAYQLGVTPYISKDYAPVEQRIKAVNHHLQSIPVFLDQATTNLNQTLAKPFVDVASMMCQGAIQELEKDATEEAAKASQATRDEFQKSRGRAVVAINNFLASLENRPTNMDFAIGRSNFQKLLWSSDRISLSVDEVLDMGNEDLAKNLEALDQTVKKLGASSLPEAFDNVRKDHPTAMSLIPDTAATLTSLEGFIRERKIVTIPSDTKCKVVETPAPMRAFASAAMNPPGPFEKADIEGHYYVTPVEDSWDEKRKEEWLRYMNHSSLKNMSAHEVYPGHFVHGLHVRAYAKTKTSKAYFNYGFTEGWAHYTEEMMLEAGYGGGDPRLKLVQLEDALLRDCRYIVAFRMHTQGMSLLEAKDFIMENAKLEELPAEREAIRGTFDHGYYGYTIGKLFIKRAKQGYFAKYPNATLGSFYDKVLSLGSAPSGMLESLVLT